MLSHLQLSSVTHLHSPAVITFVTSMTLLTNHTFVITTDPPTFLHAIKDFEFEITTLTVQVDLSALPSDLKPCEQVDKLAGEI